MSDRTLLGPAWGASLPVRKTFGRYLAVGCLSVLVDTGLLIVLRSGLGAPLWAATLIGLTAAFLLNFTLNFTWVFGAHSMALTRAARYLTLVAANFLVTLALVVELTSVGTQYVVAKFVAIAVCGVANFLLYRTWVFR